MAAVAKSNEGAAVVEADHTWTTAEPTSVPGPRSRSPRRSGSPLLLQATVKLRLLVVSFRRVLVVLAGALLTPNMVSVVAAVTVPSHQRLSIGLR